MNPKSVLAILIAAQLAATLINNEHFAHPSLAACFYYVICSALLAGITAAFYLKKTYNGIKNIWFLPLLTFGLLTIFPFLQTLICTQQDVSTAHFLLLAYALSLLSFSILSATGNINIVSIFRFITIAVVIESIVCMLQVAGWLDSKNRSFAVSGSWVNPNVTAMFLAMALPAVLHGCLTKNTTGIRERHPAKTLYICALLIGIMALVLLKCRTAYIGFVLAALIQCNNRYGWLPNIFRKYSRRTIAFIGLLLAGLATFAAISLYRFKQHSAEGRLFIWKLNLQMIAKKPVAGVGYGNYAHDYNLFQAGYFSQAKATASETANAAYVNMAYNEFLQVQAEMGFIGLLLFGCLLAGLLVRFPSRDSTGITAYAAVAAFTVMSVFNFTIQAIPVMCLFVLYAAILITTNKEKSAAAKTATWSFAPAARLLLIVTAGYLLFSQASLARSFSKTKQARDARIDGDAAGAIELLAPLKTEMRQSNIYWSEYGMALAAQRDYRNAVDKFMTALTITSDPDIYLQAGYCYQQLHVNDSAIRAYTMAQNIIPNRMTPVFALMKLYAGLQDSAQAMAMANKIMTMIPKLQSAETDLYKKEAQYLLNKNKIHNTN
jgi:O-antigen ligase